MSGDLDITRKRLTYRAHHRGTKEMDLVLGAFVDAHLAGYDADALARFEAILEETDADLNSWITLQSPVPDSDNRAMIETIVAFAQAGIGK